MCVGCVGLCRIEFFKLRYISIPIRRYGILCLTYAFCLFAALSILFIYFSFCKAIAFLFCFLCQSNQSPFLYIWRCEAVSVRDWGFNCPDTPAEKSPTDAILLKAKCSSFRSKLNIYASFTCFSFFPPRFLCYLPWPLVDFGSQ